MWKHYREITADEIREFKRQWSKKARFLVDECLGIEAAKVLTAFGWNALFVEDAHLANHSDEDIFAYAWRSDRIILTHDGDFLDDRRFPLNRNPGVIILPEPRN